MIMRLIRFPYTFIFLGDAQTASNALSARFSFFAFPFGDFAKLAPWEFSEKSPRDWPRPNFAEKISPTRIFATAQPPILKQGHFWRLRRPNFF